MIGTSSPLRHSSRAVLRSFLQAVVRAMRIVQQHHIRADDLRLAGNLLVSFVEEFEIFYYQRKVDAYISADRVSMHYSTSHLRVTRIGPQFVRHSGLWNALSEI